MAKELKPIPEAHLRREEVVIVRQGWTIELEKWPGKFRIGRVKNTGRYALLDEVTVDGSPMWENCGYLDRTGPVCFNCSMPEALRIFYHRIKNPDISRRDFKERVERLKKKAHDDPYFSRKGGLIEL